MLSGKFKIGAWLTALGTFAGFAIISLYLGWVGEVTCPCWGGTFTVSPWFAFGADILVLTLLAFLPPDFSAWQKRTKQQVIQFFSYAGVLLLGSTGIVIAILATGIVLFGSVEATVARLKNEPLSVHPPTVDFGTGSPGEHLETRVEIGNWTDQPVRLIGGTVDCTCLATSDLPICIPPGQKCSLLVKLRVPNVKSSGYFKRTVDLWTDRDERRTLRLPVGCYIHVP